MSNLKLVTIEKELLEMGVHVYPITIVKYFLNRKKILTTLSRFNDVSTEMPLLNRYYCKEDSSDCKDCNSGKTNSKKCRKHISIQRIIDSSKTENDEKVLFDVSSNLYFYKNEIFMCGEKGTFIVYCPHPKLIEGDLTNQKVRKVDYIAVPDLKITPNQKPIKYSLDSLQEQNLVCWFNYLFSIVTDPSNDGYSNWMLIPNYQKNNNGGKN